MRFTSNSSTWTFLFTDEVLHIGKMNEKSTSIKLSLRHEISLNLKNLFQLLEMEAILSGAPDAFILVTKNWMNVRG